jgi:hypothetical protein
MTDFSTLIPVGLEMYWYFVLKNGQYLLSQEDCRLVKLMDSNKKLSIRAEIPHQTECVYAIPKN